jgi:hypothetical protein
MITPITSTSELLRHVPELAKLFQSLNGAWEPGSTVDEFLTKLLKIFQSDASVFVSWNDEKKAFDYVITLEYPEPELGYIGLFYVGPHFRNNTREILKDFRRFGESRGLKKARWLSTHLTSSYRRWVAKQGAEPVAIMYQMEI